MSAFKMFLGAAALSLTFVASATTTIVTVEAQGNGKTEREAVDDALARAAGQVNGANVEVDSTTVRAGYQASVRDSWGASATVNETLEVSRSATYEAEGQIKGYKVLSSSKDTEGFRVKIKAEVFRYEVPAENVLLERVAVFPVRHAPGTYSFYGAISANELARQLGTELESKLISSRVFSLLDRETLQASIAELGLVGSDLTAPEERAKLQRIKGADYIVVSTIREAADRFDERINPVTGQRMGEFRFELEVRVIVPATGELRASNVYRIQKQHDRYGALEVMGTTAAAGVVNEIVPGRGSSVRSAAIGTGVGESSDTPRATTGVTLPFD